MIEKKEKVGTRWLKCCKTPDKQTQFKVTDVDEGSEVQFQVRAENEAGIGDPSEPTVILTIEDPTSKKLQGLKENIQKLQSAGFFRSVFFFFFFLVQCPEITLVVTWFYLQTELKFFFFCFSNFKCRCSNRIQPVFCDKCKLSPETSILFFSRSSISSSGSNHCGCQQRTHQCHLETSSKRWWQSNNWLSC